VAARNCAFCGGSPLTNEHAWPRWLQEEILAPGSEVSLRWGSAVPLERVDRKGLQVKVRRVCAACNGGWMARLEEQTKPLLLPWVRGQRTRLLSADQQTMAVWATKTVMMLQFTPIHKGGMVIADNLYREVYAHQDLPPATIWVWLGIENDQPPQGALLGLHGMSVDHAGFSGLAPLRERYLGFEATMIARHLVLKVMGHAGRAAIDLSKQVVIPAGVELTPIWPVRSSGGILLPS
jgi:hypothetical protein